MVHNPANGGFLRVMIVDHHEIFRHGLRDLVNDIDSFRVVAEAGSCQDALAQMERTTIDLMLLDLRLPDFDGIEVILHLQEFVPPPQVILLSETIDSDVLLDAMLAGASGYLAKDTPASDIIKALQGFQRGELAMQPTVTADAVHLLVRQCRQIEAKLFNYIKNHKRAFDTPSTVVQLNGGSVPTGSANSFLELLTPQEEKVFQLMRKGLSNKQIAAHLSISPFTVGKHVQNILRKLGVVNRTQAVSFTAFEGGTATYR
jgi:two-component system, NarL family, response regulator DevR